MMLHTSPASLLVAGLLALGLAAAPLHAETAAAPASQTGYTPEVGQPGKDVVWMPTAQTLVDRMLDLARVTPADRLVDLGSGDGRLVITAAQRGVPARGLEYNPDLVDLARRNAEAAGVGKLARFEEADIFATDFSDATVVTLFLLPELNLRLRPILLDMRPGTRILSNSFHMEEWYPDDRVEVTEEEGCISYCTGYLWVIPAKVEGDWALDGKVLHLVQTFQMLDGGLRGDDFTPLEEGRLDGRYIQFALAGADYVGEVSDDGKTMQGTINGEGKWRAVRETGS